MVFVKWPTIAYQKLKYKINIHIDIPHNTNTKNELLMTLQIRKNFAIIDPKKMEEHSTLLYVYPSLVSLYILCTKKELLHVSENVNKDCNLVTPSPIGIYIERDILTQNFWN